MCYARKFNIAQANMFDSHLPSKRENCFLESSANLAITTFLFLFNKLQWIEMLISLVDWANYCNNREQIVYLNNTFNLVALFLHLSKVDLYEQRKKP